MKRPRTVLRIGAVTSSIVLLAVYIGAQVNQAESPAPSADTQPSSQPSSQPGIDPSLLPGPKSAGVFEPGDNQAPGSKGGVLPKPHDPLLMPGSKSKRVIEKRAEPTMLMPGSKSFILTEPVPASQPASKPQE